MSAWTFKALVVAIVALGLLGDTVDARAAGMPDGPVSERFAAPRGAGVRWGGVIERIDHQASQLTMLIRGYPLDARGRPRIDAGSAGRFLAVASNRVDAAAYAPGALVTVTGRLSAQVTVTQRGRALSLPILRADLRELWPGPPVMLVEHTAPQPPVVAVQPVYERPYRYGDSLIVLASLALVGALLAADSAQVGIGFGRGWYSGYGHHYRFRGHHRGDGHRRHGGRIRYGVGAGYRF